MARNVKYDLILLLQTVLLLCSLPGSSNHLSMLLGDTNKNSINFYTQFANKDEFIFKNT